MAAAGAGMGPGAAPSRGATPGPRATRFAVPSLRSGRSGTRSARAAHFAVPARVRAGSLGDSLCLLGRPSWPSQTHPPAGELWCVRCVADAGHDVCRGLRTRIAVSPKRGHDPRAGAPLSRTSACQPGRHVRERRRRDGHGKGRRPVPAGSKGPSPLCGVRAQPAVSRVSEGQRPWNCPGSLSPGGG